MRKVVFRGKELATGAWVYGDLLHPATSCRIVNYDVTEEDGVLRADYHYHDVDPNTVGLYTDFQDGCGEDIYEGDILRFDLLGEGAWSVPHIVVWDTSAFWAHRAYTLAAGAPLIECYMTKSKIIGNIHDNIELIERWRQPINK